MEKIKSYDNFIIVVSEARRNKDWSRLSQLLEKGEVPEWFRSWYKKENNLGLSFRTSPAEWRIKYHEFVNQRYDELTDKERTNVDRTLSGAASFSINSITIDSEFPEDLEIGSDDEVRTYALNHTGTLPTSEVHAKVLSKIAGVTVEVDSTDKTVTVRVSDSAKTGKLKFRLFGDADRDVFSDTIEIKIVKQPATVDNVTLVIPEEVSFVPQNTYSMKKYLKVEGKNNPSGKVKWEVTGSNKIDANGNLTIVQASGNLVVSATSEVDDSKTGDATIAVVKTTRKATLLSEAPDEEEADVGKMNPVEKANYFIDKHDALLAEASAIAVFLPELIKNGEAYSKSLAAMKSASGFKRLVIPD